MGDKAEKKVVRKKKTGDDIPPCPNVPPAKPPPLLKIDQVVFIEGGKSYVVEKMLGEGGFGQVYKVHPSNEPDKKLAMKVERRAPDGKSNKNMRLKVEIDVFLRLANAPDSFDKSHFVKMHAKGKSTTFTFYVMDLIWSSLLDIIRDVCKNETSPSTKIQIARQTLKGIETLHELGYLHRDIKQANFAVGLPPNDNIIYIMDFGICRPYRENNGTLRVARASVQFMGTLKYASVRSLEKQEQSRRDDLEVWMYMMLQIYRKENIFWTNGMDRTAILKAKYELLDRSRTLLALGTLKMPKAYCDIIDLIRKMTYACPGDHKQINKFLDDIVKDEKIDEKLPLDWVGKKPKSPEKPKPEAKKEEQKKVVLEEKKDPKKEEVKEPKKVGLEEKKDPKKEEVKESNTQTLEEPKKEMAKEDKGKERRRKKGKRTIGYTSDQLDELSAMEELLEELKQKRKEKEKKEKKKTKKKKKKKKNEMTTDEYWDEEGSRSDSEIDYSDDDEEEEENFHKRNKKDHKKRSREKARTREDSDRDEEEGKERRRRKKSKKRRFGGKNKKRRSVAHRAADEKDKDIPRIPEIKEAGEVKAGKKSTMETIKKKDEEKLGEEKKKVESPGGKDDKEIQKGSSQSSGSNQPPPNN